VSAREAQLEAELAAAKVEAAAWKEAHGALARSMQPWPVLQVAPAPMPAYPFPPLLPQPPIVSVEPIWLYQPTVTC
jgi:hypothetical protein